MSEVPIFVKTRFSLIKRSMQKGWKIGREKDFQEYVDLVLDDRRLETRCDLFELQLRNTAEFADGYNNFHQNVFASDQLPNWVKERLAKCEEKYSWLNVFYKGMYSQRPDVFDDMKKYIQDVCSRNGNQVNLVNFCSIKIDDDDILSPNFFELVRSYFTEGNLSRFISFSSGFAGLWSPEEKRYVEFAKVDKPLIAIGLSYFGQFDKERGQFLNNCVLPESFNHPEHIGTENDIRHTEIYNVFPTIIDGREQVFVWTMHPFADQAYEAFQKKGIDGMESSSRRLKKGQALNDWEEGKKLFFGVFE